MPLRCTIWNWPSGRATILTLESRGKAAEDRLRPFVSMISEVASGFTLGHAVQGPARDGDVHTANGATPPSPVVRAYVPSSNWIAVVLWPRWKSPLLQKL